jgi:hypothetical protein
MEGGLGKACVIALTLLFGNIHQQGRDTLFAKILKHWITTNVERFIAATATLLLGIDAISPIVRINSTT